MKWIALGFWLLVPGAALAGDCLSGCEVESRNGHFLLNVTPGPDSVPLREHHAWTVKVQDMEGRPAVLTGLTVTGGMPGHSHGLPTQPTVSEDLGNGSYLITGFLFNMHGDWILRFQLIEGDTQDIAELTFSLDY